MTVHWHARLIAITAIVAIALPTALAAQEATTPAKKAQHHHYKLIDMATFGGLSSTYPSLNNSGITVGWSATSIPKLPSSHPFICGGTDGVGSTITVAFQWREGVVTDLGALPGEGNCSIPAQVNAHGEIAGTSENGQFDPLVGFNQSRAVHWKNGQIEDLGSFGGNQNIAVSINNRGQIVGFSTNTIADPFSLFGAVTQVRAYLWRHGVMKDLGTLGGDDAYAAFINEHGQVVGVSYTSSTPNPVTGMPPVDPFLWENGKMRDLGNFGGASSFANVVNNRGQVIGGASVSAQPGACGPGGFGNFSAGCDPFLWSEGKLIDLHTSTIGGIPITANEINDAGEIIGAAVFRNAPYDAYLWRKGVATDLGHLPGDCYSEAWAINSQGQVVGDSFSCDSVLGQFFDFHHAFLWEKGTMVDLNSLIPADSSLQLVAIGPFSFAPAPGPINDRGEIAGTGVPPGVPPGSAGFQTQVHAFLLIPCDDDHPNVEGCDYSMVDTADVSNNAATPQSPLAIPPTMDSLERTVNPSQNWFRQRYRTLVQQSPLRH